MAISDIEDSACLCAWVSALGPGPKQTLKGFVTSAQTILNVYKATWLMVNGLSQLDDEAEKAVLEGTLTIYEGVTGPIKAYTTALKNYTAPFADCPAVSTLGNTIQKIVDKINGPIDELSEKIQSYIDGIEENQQYNDTIDRWISVLDDIIDAIDNC